MSDTKKLTNGQKFSVLSQTLVLVLRGLSNGSIKAKPIIHTDDPGATEYKITSLEDEIFEALEKCGFVKKGTRKP